MLSTNNLLGNLHDSLHLTKAESKKKKKNWPKHVFVFICLLLSKFKACVVLHLQIADVICQVVFLLFFLCFQAVVEVFCLHKTREIFGLIFVLLTKTTQLCPQHFSVAVHYLALILRVCCTFDEITVVLLALYSFPHRQWNKQNYSTPILEMLFTFLWEKLFEKIFSHWKIDSLDSLVSLLKYWPQIGAAKGAVSCKCLWKGWILMILTG